ncbi:MAG TPA: DUF1049 domain-containing protein [Lactobacillus sp.]|nr:DUF1049 domain-containing protein [Lactobacillus sp.]
MKNQWRLIAGLILVLIVAIFAVMNGNSVPIHFGVTTVKWPMILILIVSLLLGALIALLVTAGNHVSRKRSDKQADSEVATENEQLKKQNAALTTKNEQLNGLVSDREKTIERLQQEISNQGQGTNESNS